MATDLDAMMKLWELPTAEGRDGIHISAQLRVDAMQLNSNRIQWAGRTMETAASHIDAIEVIASELPAVVAALREALATGLKADIATIERLAAVAEKAESRLV